MHCISRHAQAEAFEPVIKRYGIKAGFLTYGCAPHAFNLHAKDLCAIVDLDEEAPRQSQTPPARATPRCLPLKRSPASPARASRGVAAEPSEA